MCCADKIIYFLTLVGEDFHHVFKKRQTRFYYDTLSLTVIEGARGNAEFKYKIFKILIYNILILINCDTFDITFNSV